MGSDNAFLEIAGVLSGVVSPTGTFSRFRGYSSLRSPVYSLTLYSCSYSFFSHHSKLGFFIPFVETNDMLVCPLCKHLSADFAVHRCPSQEYIDRKNRLVSDAAQAVEQLDPDWLEMQNPAYDGPDEIFTNYGE